MIRLISFVLVLLGVLGSLRSEDPKSPFAIAVVPSWSSGEGGGISMASKAPTEFYVVLTNISREPQSVWETWNSWGYQVISFELITANGHNLLLTKREQDFDRNFPSTFVVQPGEHQVFPIRLDKEWVASPAVPKASEMPITLKAIYEVTPTPEAPLHKVWTGRVESQSYGFTLRQW